MLFFAHGIISDLIIINNCHHLLSLYSTKTCWRTNHIKMENNEYKKVCIKNRMRYYFNDITKFQDFELIMFQQMKNHAKVF